ncbi:hypothetical protein GE061_002696 [Apolygus lucorum]|uniref:Multiple inositol polyphosphate phosphatase 1 n=1 Tax=Apolygus lucorum TaxID=248454 RepID=A0A8S9X9X4_APOLU|nr:hypothetical protein GE061_002696 [Apolygus lucorum]
MCMMTLIYSHLLVFLLCVTFQTKCDSVREPDLTGDRIVRPVLDEHKCKRFDEDILRHLGTKTPYRVVANADEATPAYQGCTPIYIAGVVRHGTRTPGVKDADRMRKNLEKIKASSFVPETELESPSLYQDSTRGTICQSEKDHIMSWKLTLESEEGKTLTREGEDEMFKLAQRYQKRYPDLLPKTYANSTFLFKFTQTQRTEESAKHFTTGLFGKDQSRQVWFPEALDKDPILRFYKLCERWKEDVKNNESSKEELIAYKNTAEALFMTREISRHLRLNYTLSYDDVYLMYVTCAFEVAWHKERRSPWCVVFTREDIQVLEYGEELKYYWRDGYGFDVNHQQACVLTRDIFDRFESRKESGQKALFYFTHSGTLLKLLSHLGLYRDAFKLKHDITGQQRRDRSWRVSYIDTFGTNFVFVFYNCSGDLKVLTLHQERVVHVPGCPGGDLCPLDALRQLLGANESCQFATICNSSQSGHYEL